MEEVYSFPPQLRLKTPDQYKKVFADPVRTTDKYFTVLAIRNQLNYPRLGLAIAKKNIKKAIKRNLIKRVIRENFRLKQHQLGNLDIVVLARKDAGKAHQHLLKHSLEKHWLKL